VALLRARVAAARWAFSARCRTASNKGPRQTGSDPGIARELRKHVTILEREIAGRAITGEAGAPGGRPAPKEAAGRLLPYPWRNNNGAIRTSIPAGWLSPTAAPGIVGDVQLDIDFVPNQLCAQLTHATFVALRVPAPIADSSRRVMARMPSRRSATAPASIS
jgi:hypothetical protein